MAMSVCSASVGPCSGGQIIAPAVCKCGSHLGLARRCTTIKLSSTCRLIYGYGGPAGRDTRGLRVEQAQIFCDAARYAAVSKAKQIPLPAYWTGKFISPEPPDARFAEGVVARCLVGPMQNRLKLFTTHWTGPIISLHQRLRNSK